MNKDAMFLKTSFINKTIFVGGITPPTFLN